MKALRTVLLWLLALVVLGLVSWGLTLYLEWPLWAAAAIFFGVLGAFMMLIVLRRMLLAYRSRSIIARQRRAEKEAAQRGSRTGALRSKFREAAGLLRSSSLKRLGNPLYVLPWYLVIGRPGAGKTTALARTRLSTSLQDQTQNGAPVPQTENCDWWYFDRSIVLDCAGRYVGAENEEDDRREWNLVLDLLSRYRGREGINGLVLAVSADRLVTPDREEIDQEARVIRARIEQLIRLFGRRFPVYVLVTKCDQLYGFERWSTLLPETALSQAMGHLAPAGDEAQSTESFLTNAFDAIVARLRAMRIALVARHPQSAVELLLFPNELDRLRAGAELFVEACLGESPYLESPFLRGVFFSSGLQAGGARSAVLPDTLHPTPPHEPTTTGVFLHDLFGRILPQDRNVAKPAALVNRWLAATQNLGLFAWLLCAIAIGVLITMSFFRNVNTLALIEHNYPFQQHYSGLLVDDAATLSRANDALLEIDRRSHNWRSRWMISSKIDELQDRLHKQYVRNYLSYIRPAVERDVDVDLRRDLVNDTDQTLPLSTLNEVRTTNLLKAKLAGADRPQLASMPQPVYSDMAPWSPRLFDQVNGLRISYIAWSETNSQEIVSRLAHQQATLNQALYIDQMHWLTQLAPIDNQLRDVTLADFWLDANAARAQALRLANASDSAPPTVAGGRVAAQAQRNRTTRATDDPKAVEAERTGAELAEAARLGAIKVAAAYTRAGRADIDGYLKEVKDAVDDDAHLAQQQALFERTYQNQRFETWQNFVQSVPQGEQMLSGRDAWRSRLPTITQSTSPYLRALDRLNEEFETLSDAQLPDWLQTARHMGRLRRDATGALIAGKAGGIVQSINSFGGQALRETLSNDPSAGATSLRINTRAAAAMRDYFQNVNQIAATVTDGEAKAYTVAAAFHGFGVDPAVKTSPVHDAARALLRLRDDVDSNGAADQAIWHLIGGPLHFVLAYTEEEASCALQSDWDSKVYWPLQSATSMSQVVDQLYGPQGSVWNFVDGPAKPFLTHGANTISEVQTADYSVPFTTAFLPTLNSAVGKRVAQLMETQRAKARAESDAAQAQAAQEQAKQQQTNAETALADIKQKIATAEAVAYPLSITAQPIDVNPSARVRPFATVLTVQCASGAHTLTNFNFPVSDTFNWTLGQCGEVTLLIRFDGLTLSKRYRGDAGVVSFLRDFRDGHRLFTPQDFPSSASALAQRGIEQITVRYEFRGEDAIIDGATQLAQLMDERRQQTQTRQQAIDTLAAQTQQLLLIKLANTNGGAEPRPLRVSLPQRIGVCWNQNALPASTQTLQQRFDSLLEPRGPLVTAAAPAYAPVQSQPTGAPDVPPLPTLPNTVTVPTGASGS
ncbi:type VI secretion protein IcmF/TssM N-terminal domain-containing protein [Caballeronia sp. LZ034LL]|uniref:type VI secretion protein IcmF/TssM N-terminal domain-containing protein n=1 Tax=Caballeronia sp. LZ034LL TaxID=3038567 RepID=UPI002861CA37|nr:type VI secretion protein IcmF/TssM N-terminal domain-containing protein [Caballeronia sp. LZ034LL]MDR5837093.1 type VI secretion protein IcmF/TssM N-terminal domain-containing protein [Caballeronia sp. LZ034LL]